VSTRKVGALPARKVRPISREVVLTPSGGINSTGAPSLIGNKEWSDLLNIQFAENGVARKRFGYKKTGGTLTSAKGLGSLVTDSYNHLVTVDSGVFKYSEAGAWTTVSSISYTPNVIYTYTQARGKLYIWNGSDGGSEWDGGILARPGTMPKAKFSVFYNSYHIASGVDGQSSRVYISNLDNSSDFTNAAGDAKGLDDSTKVPGATVFAGTGANFIDIQPNDGDRITGLGVFADQVVVFKQFAIYQLAFDDTGNPVVSPITRATGCVSPRSVVPVENDLYFLSREGVRVLGNEANYFNSIRTSIISKNIENLTIGMDEASFAKANAIYYNNEYILSIPDSGGNLTYTVVYNRNFKSWTKWGSLDAQAFRKYVDVNNNLRLMFLKSTGTQMYEFTPDVYNDDGAPIEAFMLSKVFDFKNPDITKYFVDLGLMFRTITGEVPIEIYTAGNVLFGGSTTIVGNPVTDGMGYSVLGYTVLGEGGGESGTREAFTDAVVRVDLKTKSTNIRFKISNNKANENFVLLGYVNAFYPFTHFLFDSSKKIYL
jgi:hypothetical protein